MSVLNIVISRCRSCDSVVRVRAVSKQNEKMGEKEKKEKKGKGKVEQGIEWKTLEKEEEKSRFGASMCWPFGGRDGPWKTGG